MKIQSFQVAVIFEKIDGIIFTLGNQVKKFQSEYNARVQTLNIPQNSPPEVPRATISTSDFVINIGLNRFDIFLKIPNQINTELNKITAFVTETIKEIANILINEEIKYLWSGVIAAAEYPHSKEGKPSVQLLQTVFDKVVNIDRKGRDLASFNFNFGFREDKFFKNYTIAGYETIKIPSFPQLPPNTSIEIDLSEKQLAESGLSVAIDINSRPNTGDKDFWKDITAMTAVFESSVVNLVDDLLLDGVING